MSADPMSPAELDEIRETAERMVWFIAEHGMAAIEATVTDAPLHVLTLRRLLATIDASVVCERNTFQSLRYAEMARDKALEKEAEVTQERDDARLALLVERGAYIPKGWRFEEGRQGVQPWWRRGVLEVRRLLSGRGWALWRWDNKTRVSHPLDSELSEEEAGIPSPEGALEWMLAGDRWAANHPDMMTVEPLPPGTPLDGRRWA